MVVYVNISTIVAFLLVQSIKPHRRRRRLRLAGPERQESFSKGDALMWTLWLVTFGSVVGQGSSEIYATATKYRVFDFGRIIKGNTLFEARRRKDVIAIAKEGAL
jgi:hypothetical protein